MSIVWLPSCELCPRKHGVTNLTLKKKEKKQTKKKEEKKKKEGEEEEKKTKKKNKKEEKEKKISSREIYWKYLGITQLCNIYDMNLYAL